MFREMRRSKQALTEQECLEVLHRGTSGVLAVAGDDGYPYAVPLSYAYQDGSIYFHGAITGHKVDAIDNCSKVSFCVIDRDEVVPEKLTTVYRSVIVFGRARVLDDERKIAQAARILGEKYLVKHIGRDAVEQEITREMPRLAVIRLDIEHMTGKEGVELVAQKKPELFDGD